jgi:hypothetical protein
VGGGSGTVGSTYTVLEVEGYIPESRLVC